MPTSDITSPTADLIVHNGRITTLAEPSEVSAMAVQGELIVATGSDAEVLALASEATRVIDLHGRRVIPGLNDVHLHGIRAGLQYNLELRWDGVADLAAGLQMISEQAPRTPHDHWVRVMGGWSPYQFSERRFPSIAELNSAGGDAKVAVLFAYSQLFINENGLVALGITPADRPIGDGTYEFVDGGLIASGTPTIYALLAKLPGLDPEFQINSTQHFFNELNRFGITSFIDAGATGVVFPDDYSAINTLADGPGFPVRIANFLFPQKSGDEIRDFTKWTKEDPVRRNLAADRSGGFILTGAGEILEWDASDYEDFMKPRPEWSSHVADDLTEVVRLIVSRDWSIRIHATYGETIAQILDVFEPEFKNGEYARRWAIDHAETITSESIDRVKSLGGAIAVQDRLVFSGEFFAERYGEAAAASAQPMRDLIEAGVPIGGGTDATRVASYNPWLSIYWFVTRTTLGGLEFGGDRHKLTREEALRIYSHGSAWLSDEDDAKGTLEVGRLADFAVLSSDAMTIPDEQLLHVESVLTVVGGDVVYAVDAFEGLAPKVLDEAQPDWSPVRWFGGFQK